MYKLPTQFLSSALIFGLMSLAGPAHAALMYNLDLRGYAPGLSGTGSITLPESPLTGTDPGDVISFSLAGTGPLGSFSFGLGDIDSIWWWIDSSTMSLELDEFWLGNTLNSSGTGTCLFWSMGVCFAESSDGSSIFNSSSEPHFLQVSNGGTSVDEGFNLDTTFISRIPEPASLSMFLLGLLGLATACGRKLSFSELKRP